MKKAKNNLVQNRALTAHTFHKWIIRFNIGLKMISPAISAKWMITNVTV